METLLAGTNTPDGLHECFGRLDAFDNGQEAFVMVDAAGASRIPSCGNPQSSSTRMGLPPFLSVAEAFRMPPATNKSVTLKVCFVNN